MSPSSRAVQRVLIVGGGLAGPCLALSLARHGISSVVFELRSHRATQGGSITLMPNALQVLDKYAGVYDRLRAIGYSYSRMSAYAEDGEKFGEIILAKGSPADTDGKSESGYPALRIMRTAVQDALLDAAEASDLIEVKYGMRISSIQDVAGESGVTAHFEDGSSWKGGTDGHSLQPQGHRWS